MTTTVDVTYGPAEVRSPDKPKGGVVYPNFYSPMVKDKYGHEVVESWDQHYVGHVLRKYERNGYDDSDFMAVIYDDETDSFKHVEYASTRGWSYYNSATVDATDEVKTKAREVVRRATLARLASAAAAEAKSPEVGKAVIVTKGRKVAKGTPGTVVWKGVDSYKSSQYATHYRVGVKTPDGTEFMSADNVEVVDPQDYMPDWSDLEARAAYRARGDNFD